MLVHSAAVEFCGIVVSAQVYQAAASPVEGYYREAGVLLDFEITGGIPETTPRLMAALDPYIKAVHRRESNSSSKEQRAAVVGQ